MNRKKKAAVFARFSNRNPHPRGELRYRSRFQLLIAVMLSAQATDISVNKATKKLFREAGTAQKMYALGEEGLKRHIRTIGLFNSKAGNIIRTCRILLDEYAGRIPRVREELERLPGVGRKTANVVLNNAFGEPTIAVDTHIFRVSNRTGIAPGRTPLAVEKGLLKSVPDEFKRHAHHWLILHGRYVCTARSPACSTCLINDLCEYRSKRP